MKVPCMIKLGPKVSLNYLQFEGSIYEIGIKMTSLCLLTFIYMKPTK